jgi:hypothetical protein
MRFLPERFSREIFAKMKDDGKNLEWICAAFLQFLALKPSDKYNKLDFNKIYEKNVIITKRNCPNIGSIEVNQLTDEIFKWLTSQDKGLIENNFKKLFDTAIIKRVTSRDSNLVYSFSIADFQKLIKLLGGNEDFKKTYLTRHPSYKTMRCVAHTTMDRSDICERYTLAFVNKPISACSSLHAAMQQTRDAQECRVVLVTEGFLQQQSKDFAIKKKM